MGGLCGPAPPLSSPACPPVELLLLRLVGLTLPERGKGRWAWNVDGERGVIQSLGVSVSWGAVWVRGVCDGMVWGCEGSRRVFAV